MAGAALRSAREKYYRAEPLGIDLRETIEAARKEHRETIQSRSVRSSAAIGRLGQGVKAPELDGVLNEPAWKEPPQMTFVSILSDPDQRPSAKTWAQATYDDSFLYLGYRCEEPHVESLKSRGQRDGDVWAGDGVELFISIEQDPDHNRHFIVDSQNKKWDGTATDPKWNGKWRSAAKVGPGEWSVEMAIPWDEIGGRPAPGAKRRVNLCRHRPAQQPTEYSSWSPVLKSFLEFDRFGTWTFGE